MNITGLLRDRAAAEKEALAGETRNILSGFVMQLLRETGYDSFQTWAREEMTRLPPDSTDDVRADHLRARIKGEMIRMAHDYTHPH